MIGKLGIGSSRLFTTRASWSRSLTLPIRWRNSARRLRLSRGSNLPRIVTGYPTGNRRVSPRGIPRGFLKGIPYPQQKESHEHSRGSGSGFYPGSGCAVCGQVEQVCRDSRPDLSRLCSGEAWFHRHNGRIPEVSELCSYLHGEHSGGISGCSAGFFGASSAIRPDDYAIIPTGILGDNLGLL